MGKRYVSIELAFLCCQRDLRISAERILAIRSGQCCDRTYCTEVKLEHQDGDECERSSILVGVDNMQHLEFCAAIY